MATLTKEKYYVIETKAQHKLYCDVLENLLWGKKVKTLEDKRDIKLLTLLIETWEEQYSNSHLVKDPIVLLTDLMKGRNLKQKDLAKLLNVSEGLVSDILSYKKQLSKTVIRDLSLIFKVRQELFNRA